MPASWPMPGPIRIVFSMARGARAVWILGREPRTLLKSLEYGSEMLIRGGLTIRTPDTVEDALIATTVQLDGDVLVEISNTLLLSDPETQETHAAQHALDVQAKLALLTHIPDLLRAAHAALFGIVAACGTAVLVQSWGTSAMVWPVAAPSVYLLAGRWIKGWLARGLGYVTRYLLAHVLTAFRADSAKTLADIRQRRAALQ